MSAQLHFVRFCTAYTCRMDANRLVDAGVRWLTIPQLVDRMINAFHLKEYTRDILKQNDRN